MANTKKTVLASLLGETTLVRGISSILIFLVIWQIGALCDDWFGVDILGIGLVPPPTDVFIAFLDVIPKVGYWQSWVASFSRVLTGLSFTVSDHSATYHKFVSIIPSPISSICYIRISLNHGLPIISKWNTARPHCQMAYNREHLCRFLLSVL